MIIEGGQDLEDLYGFFGTIKKGVKGAAKGIGKGASAAGKFAVKTAPSFVGKAAIAPFTFQAKLGSNLAKGAFGQIGKTVGTVAATPFRALGAFGKGAKQGAGFGGKSASSDTATAAAEVQQARGGGGGGYVDAGGSFSSGGGGGGGVETSAPASLMAEESTAPSTGMSTGTKIALGLGAVAGAWLLYKKFGRGGRRK